MSKKNLFQVNPIFFLPIDLGENSKIPNNDNSSSDLDISSSIEEEDEDKKIITFSLSKNNHSIKSKTNSSKIYISEILKKNWKIKIRRLMAKQKKRLIKQWKNMNLKNIEYNEYNNKTNFIKNIIIKSNNINNNFDFYINTNNNHIKKINSLNHINNNILAHIVCNNNNFEANNNLNIYSNIKLNCNNSNNNLTYLNSLINKYNTSNPLIPTSICPIKD